MNGNGNSYCISKRLAATTAIPMGSTILMSRRITASSNDWPTAAILARGIRSSITAAAEYEVPPQGNRFFFFNPFALHTLKRVLGKLFDAHYQAPRPMRLFFYYPYEETEAFLTHHPNLVVEDVIDCRDLFDEDDDREKILVLRLRD